MALMTILTYPDPRLAQKSLPVEVFDDELKNLCADMLETMYHAPGIGLAAPQVNVHKQVLVIDIDYESAEEDSKKIVNQNPRVFINPKIIQREGETLYKEGCLSVPGEYEEVKRAERIVVQFQDVEGVTHQLEAGGLLAIALQHEIDHLDGRLFIDRLSFLKSKSIKKRIKREKEWEELEE